MLHTEGELPIEQLRAMYAAMAEGESEEEVPVSEEGGCASILGAIHTRMFTLSQQPQTMAEWIKAVTVIRSKARSILDQAETWRSDSRPFQHSSNRNSVERD
jgi:hypothetical protein